MTVYNHQNYLNDSIKSILNQTYKNWELIIIDNGSTDFSKNYISKFQNKKIKKIYLKKNIGRTNCLNYGLKFCKGEYVAILDSDDIAMPNRLKIQINYLSNDKNLYLVGSDHNLINDNKIILKKKFKKKDLSSRNLIFNNFIMHSSIMFKKKLIYKIGKYPSAFKYAQDYAFYLKVLKKYKIKIIKNKLVHIRHNHRNSETYRLKNTKIIFEEEKKLLIWSYKNLKPNFNEKTLIIFNIIKIQIKQLFNNYPINIFAF